MARLIPVPKHQKRAARGWRDQGATVAFRATTAGSPSVDTVTTERAHALVVIPGGRVTA